ncbi:hypothetical protein CANINC_002678 [Pichia inconspicua]|uniref:Zn(2)-C6 fungal-type domain-containing protein n=1 Tax=Pichia inconspicua TaxID=52247 RepID=A0A4T0X107_9ASCO|nr:hypothetical protein CANINC_002678 [[Candida] inconspicua]
MTKTIVKPLSVKSIGRAHLACQRCRTQKIKCSGGQPSCINCLTSKKECKYPPRDKQVTLLESQLNKLYDKIRLLESQVPQKDLVEFSPPKEKEHKFTNGYENENENENENEEQPKPSLHETNQNLDDNSATIAFESIINNGISYYGISSGQVFDSELKSHLFEITEDSHKSILSPKPQSRHFFKDPSLESTFSGVVMLPDKKYALSLIDKVIRFLSHEYYLFDPKDFYKQVDEAYEKLRDKKPLWICYFLITLAVGEQYCNTSPDGEIPGMRFYSAAMRLYKTSYEEPTLEFVQMLLLIAFYLQGLNSANAAFSFYGLTIRSALIQGLHRKVGNVSPVEKEKRKRLWWTVFNMDTVWSSNLGHPIHVQLEDIDVELPMENYIDLNDGYNIQLLDYNIKLSNILAKVMRNVYSAQKGKTSIKVKKVLECVEEFDKLYNMIPSNIKDNLLLSNNRSTANLYLRINHYIIVTTRPLLLSLFKGHIQPTDSIKRAISRCVNSAISTIEILSSLKSNGWLSAFGFWDAQTETGRQINKYMKDSGNFTALDNEIKLKELDELLSKIPTYTLSLEKQDKSETLEESRDSPMTATSVQQTSYSHYSSPQANSFPELFQELGEPISDFSSFRNNVSPDTWVELTSKLWDPANI